ncbi:MAG TPA: hypothetical protein PKI32_10550 [Opitutales bacterium]|nr:hypothetical protein [Opitutales bacterium]
MKSAYEMALARMGLREDDKPRAFTDAQRAELSDIDRRYSARLAEREIVLRGEIEKCREAQNLEEMERLRQLLVRERAEIDEERELARERVRKNAE